MGAQETYHYGQTVKEYRLLHGMTQEELAAQWPKVDGDSGVNVRYVQDVEYGRKHIDNPAVLRRLAALLAIPLWRFGLSEYDPFNPQGLRDLPGQGRSMYSETLDTAESLIRQVWSLRCAARIAEAERGVRRLNALFAYFREYLPPPARLEHRFQLLAVQVHRLNAAAVLENKDYAHALALYQRMGAITARLDDPAAHAQALLEIGKELERAGKKQQAVTYLEDARDLALHSSKRLLAFVHSYLARSYGGAGDALRFERAIQTGLSLARSLHPEDEDGSDFVYSWSAVSAMLAEQSWGYLVLNQPQKTLAMRQEITEALERGQDARVLAWIPLDWSSAYLQLGDVESAVQEAREFYRRSRIMQSAHATSQTKRLLQEMQAQGYGKLAVVRDLQEELATIGA
jgi:transcriptional regulator with XRE-family HTH domain